MWSWSSLLMLMLLLPWRASESPCQLVVLGLNIRVKRLGLWILWFKSQTCASASVCGSYSSQGETLWVCEGKV